MQQNTDRPYTEGGDPPRPRRGRTYAPPPIAKSQLLHKCLCGRWPRVVRVEAVPQPMPYDPDPEALDGWAVAIHECVCGRVERVAHPTGPHSNYTRGTATTTRGAGA